MSALQIQAGKLEHSGILGRDGVPRIGILIFKVGITLFKITAVMFTVGTPAFRVTVLGFKVGRLLSIV